MGSRPLFGLELELETFSRKVWAGHRLKASREGPQSVILLCMCRMAGVHLPMVGAVILYVPEKHKEIFSV